MAHDSLIDESVSQLAGYFTEILMTKGIDRNATAAELFESFADYLKSEVATGDTPLNLNAAQAFHDRRRRIAEQLMADEEAERAKKPPTTKGTTMSRTEEMETMNKFIKSTPNGFASVAKQIVDKGDTGLTEHNFIELWKSDAADHKQEKETAAQAFAREFGGERTEKHDAYDIVHAAALGYPVA
jgi:hypothetical protein